MKWFTCGWFIIALWWMLNQLWNVDRVLDEFWNDDEMLIEFLMNDETTMKCLIEFLMNVETTMKCYFSWWLTSRNGIRDGWSGF